MADLEKALRVDPESRVRLDRIDPAGTPGVRGKASGRAETERNVERLFDLQYRLYAENRRAVLVVLQAMDAGGKDGTIRHVMAGLNPQGCRVTSFKVPSAEELAHDYLWRIHHALPPRGSLGIFNRSHYEDVLVVRVHDLVPKDVWSARYEQINAFEKHVVENGTTILKFYLHVSRDEQLRRLKERIDDPTKQWKVALGDFEERKRWDDYMAAYTDALERCSTPWAPWFVVPADKKWYRNLAVSRIIIAALEAMNPKFPKPSFDPKKIRIE